MRNLAALGNKARTIYEEFGCVRTVAIDGVPVHFGLIETPEPGFDGNAPGNEHKVLLRVTAFSLNYRDKNRIFTMALKGREDGFYVLGSEFAGVILESGAAVASLAPGDRIMGNNCYPDSGWPGLAPGVPTNHSSKEFLVLHEAKLMKVPDGMPDAVAASFSIGAQTTYGMIRRLGIAHRGSADLAGETNILVTSAKSNTSLFAINALRKFGVNVYATSTTDCFAGRLKEMGASLVVVCPETPFFENPVLREVLERAGGFPFVIDPFSDPHLSRALDVMAFGGRYITCGLYDQYLRIIGKQPPARQTTGREMFTMVFKNLEIFGNCAGSTEDLSNALCDYSSGSLDVVLDSTWSEGHFAEFLTRTYCAPDRFGKVVYQYD